MHTYFYTYLRTYIHDDTYLQIPESEQEEDLLQY